MQPRCARLRAWLWRFVRQRGCCPVVTYAGPMPEQWTIGDYMGQQAEAQGQQPQHLRGLVLSTLPLSAELRILSRKGCGSTPAVRTERRRASQLRGPFRWSEWCGILVRAVLTLRFHSARFRSLRQQPFGEV